MNPFRSVGGRLSIALVLVVAAALALVDLIVVPSLERNLINSKLSELRDAAPGIKRQVQDAAGANLDLVLQDAAAGANARVSLFTALDPDTLLPVADSNGVSSSDLTDDPIALRSARTLRKASGTVERGTDRYAEAALPMSSGSVLLLSASLHDSLANIHQVRRRLLIAGLIALVASLIVGYGAASMFARSG